MNKTVNNKCLECNHDIKYHTKSGCIGAFPNGTEGLDPQEIFYGECHCHNLPDKNEEKLK